MAKRYSLWGFLGSLFIHGIITFSIIALVFGRNSQSANGVNAELIDTNISMEMLQGMIQAEPEPEPEPEVKQEEPKEEIADPTVKPEPKKVEKPKEIKKLEKKPLKEKPKPKQKKKVTPKDVVIGDKNVDSKDKVNSKATATGPVTTNNPNLSGNGGNTDELSAYRSALRREIERHKRYTDRARRMRKQGIVTVSFNIAANGSLSNIRVTKSSGSSELDEAALLAVKGAKNIGPRPVGLGESISVPISFKLR